MISALALSATKGPPPPWWFFVVFFLGIWVVVSFTLSRVSGWTRLAQHYPADRSFDGQLIRFQAAQFRAATNYNGCLDFGANYEGLYIVPMFLFRAFHPPLLIPWSDITARPIKLWGIWNFIELRFQRAPDIPVRIKVQLAQRLAAASMGRFSLTSTTPA